MAASEAAGARQDAVHRRGRDDRGGKAGSAEAAPGHQLCLAKTTQSMRRSSARLRLKVERSAIVACVPKNDRCSKSACRCSRNSRWNRRERTRTGRKKPGRQAIQRPRRTTRSASRVSSRCGDEGQRRPAGATHRGQDQVAAAEDQAKIAHAETELARSETWEAQEATKTTERQADVERVKADQEASRA
jgi:hypothetical protein